MFKPILRESDLLKPPPGFRELPRFGELPVSNISKLSEQSEKFSVDIPIKKH